MTREEIKDFCDMKAQMEPENEDVYKEIVKALEQETCGDCISREAVLAMSDYIGETPTYSNPYAKLEEVVRVEDIKSLPLVQPKSKTEKCKWIRYDHRTICPQNHDIDNPYWRIPENTACLKYCPYCSREIEVTK